MVLVNTDIVIFKMKIVTIILCAQNDIMVP